MLALFLLTTTSLIINRCSEWVSENNFTCPDLTSNQIKDIQSQISAGERTLAKYEGKEAKNKEAFDQAKENYRNAITHNDKNAIKFLIPTREDRNPKPEFYKNAPETLIYINNDLIKDQLAYTIAVAAPINSERNFGLGVLRGVALAQEKINNEEGGIEDANGKKSPLKVVLVDDRNVAKNNINLACYISRKSLDISAINKDIRIIGLIGHQTSDLTLSFGNIYQKAKLPVISPSATSAELFGKFNHVHLVAPTTHQMAKKLSQEMRKEKVIVFYDSDEEFSKSFGTEVCNVIKKDNCQPWDFSINPPISDQTIRNMLSDSKTELVIAFNPNQNDENRKKVSTIIDAVAEFNNRNPQDRIELFSDNALYDYQTIKYANNKGVTIVRVSPWDRYLSVKSSQHNIEKINQSFLDKNKKIWGTDQVNWYTLMSYNATKSLALAIKKTGLMPPRKDEDPTDIRRKTNDIINSNNFKVDGALGEISFKDGYVQSGNFVCITRVGASPNSQSNCQPGEEIQMKNENHWSWLLKVFNP